MVKFKRVLYPTKKLVDELLMDIRKPDLKELIMGPEEPYQSVWDSIQYSKHCYAVRDREGNLLAIFGLGAGPVDINGGRAVPIWFLGTNKAYRHNRALVYYGKQFAARWIEEAGTLCNFIWVGNEPYLRYIMHLGGQLLDPVPMGNRGEIFFPFLLKEVK